MQRGTEGEPEEELQQLLRYMEHTTEENARNATLRNIQRMVEKVKQDGEVSLEYMKIFEREEMLIKQGRKEERANTEREKARADEAEMRAGEAEARAAEAEMRAAEAEAELRRLKEEIERLKNNKL